MNSERRTDVTVGFMPLLDCALLVVAHEVGMARHQGISLRLVRESSWANIRDRLAVGHFDAAHMLAPMVVAQNLGAGHLDTPLVAPVALGTGGNAITLSTTLWGSMQDAGAAIGATPAVQAAALARVIRQRAGQRLPALTLAMVFPFSCHNYQLRDWLATAGVDPDRDVRLVVLPPPLLVDALGSGQIDGFCVGEPWNSLAVEHGIGVMAAACVDVWPRPPEKVLGLRAGYADENPAIVAALVRAIHGAARWAAEPDNREDLARLLGQPRYVGAPPRVLLAAMRGVLPAKAGHEPLWRPEFVSFGPDDIIPHARYGDLIYARMCSSGQVRATEAGPGIARGSFLPDGFQAALAGGAKRV